MPVSGDAQNVCAITIVGTVLKGCSLCYCGAIYRRAILFARSMNHIPPCLFLSRADDDDVRNNGKCDFRSVLIHPMLSNANFSIPVFTAEAAGKASFVHSCMGTRLKVDSMENDLIANIYCPREKTKVTNQIRTREITTWLLCHFLHRPLA